MLDTGRLYGVDIIDAHSHKARRGPLALAALLVSRPCHAGDPFEIQVYDGTANAAGEPGIELHLNAWATGNREYEPPEAPLHGQLHATVEPSLGVLPFWEVGAYLQSAVRTDVGAADWAGVKLRSKFVTLPTFHPRIRLGVNLEVSYVPPTYDRDRWGLEVRPIVAWHDPDWLFAFNPILDQSLAGPGASAGPSFEPALKAARTLGQVALGLEYYATLGPFSSFVPWREQEQRLFECADLLGVRSLELNACLGQGLSTASAGLVFKVIVGWVFEK